MYDLNRTSEQSEDAHRRISAGSGRPPDPPVPVDCDLLDFANVRRAQRGYGSRKKPRGTAIDFPCLNAGVMLQEDRCGADGCTTSPPTANILSHLFHEGSCTPC